MIVHVDATGEEFRCVSESEEFELHFIRLNEDEYLLGVGMIQDERIRTRIETIVTSLGCKCRFTFAFADYSFVFRCRTGSGLELCNRIRRRGVSMDIDYRAIDGEVFLTGRFRGDHASVYVESGPTLTEELDSEAEFIAIRDVAFFHLREVKLLRTMARDELLALGGDEVKLQGVGHDTGVKHGK